MGNLTREEILARRLGHGVVQLDDGAGTVEVRGLNMREVRQVGSIEEPIERDIMLMVLGMVDPVMTADDVRLWMEEDAGGVVDRVGRKIGELSATVEGAGKSGVPRSRRRSGS